MSEEQQEVIETEEGAGEQTEAAATGDCFNDDCKHFDKSQTYGCGCGNENDEQPFVPHDCVHFVAGEPETEQVEESTTYHADLPVSDSFMYNLPVFLTDVELGCYSKEQADLWREWGKLNQQKKDSSKAYGDAIKRVEDKLDDITRIVEEGSEKRPVKCFWLYDYQANEKILYRADVNKEVERRTLTKEEIDRYQNPELFGAETSTDDALAESIANVNAAFPDKENVCYNSECGSYAEGEGNNCSVLEYVSDCEFKVITPDASTTIEENTAYDGSTVEEGTA